MRQIAIVAVTAAILACRFGNRTRFQFGSEHDHGTKKTAYPCYRLELPLLWLFAFHDVDHWSQKPPVTAANSTPRAQFGRWKILAGEPGSGAPDA